MSLRWRPPSALRGVVPVGRGGISWVALFDDRTVVRVSRPDAAPVALFDDRERPLATRRDGCFGPAPEGARSLGLVVGGGQQGAVEMVSLARLVEASEGAAEEIGDLPFPGRRGPAGGCVACGTATTDALCERCRGVIDAADRAGVDDPERVVPIAVSVTGLARPLDLLGIELWPASFTLVAAWAGRFLRLPPLRLDVLDDEDHRYTGVVRQVYGTGAGTELVWSAVPALAADARSLRVVIRGAGGPLVDLVVPLAS